MAVGMIPHDGDTQFGESTVVATSHRIVPWTVVRFQLQAVFLDVLFQPVAEGRCAFGVEVNHMFRFGFIVVAAYHVEVQVTFHFLDFRVSHGKVAGAQQPFFLAVPEGEDDGTFRLLSGSQEGTYNLKSGGYTRSVVVRTVVNLVTVQHRVVADVVVMCAQDNDFVGPFSFNLYQDVAHVVFLVYAFGLDGGDRVRMNL